MAQIERLMPSERRDKDKEYAQDNGRRAADSAENLEAERVVSRDPGGRQRMPRSVYGVSVKK